MDRLPDELLPDILRRLPPRSLAACRAVCKHWRSGVIDANGLLQAVARRVPRDMRGVFVNRPGRRSGGHRFFSIDRDAESSSSIPLFSLYRASPAPDTETNAAAASLCGRRTEVGETVVDHRSGLLLCREYWQMCEPPTLLVCNPATGRHAELPPRPPPVNAAGAGEDDDHGSEYLLFDPTVSLHYDVLFFPDVPYKLQPPFKPGRVRHLASTLERLFPEHASLLQRAARNGKVGNDVVGSLAWPPASYPVQAFSSRTGRWEERRFAREGDTAAVTVSDVWSDPWGPRSASRQSSDTDARCNAVCWRGAFYLHCRGGFVTRFSLQDQKYLVIKTPQSETTYNKRVGPKYITPSVYLGKSEQGVYYTQVYSNQLRIWVLREASESHQTPRWEMKHYAFLEPSFFTHYARSFRVHNIDYQTWKLGHGDQQGGQVDQGIRGETQNPGKRIKIEEDPIDLHLNRELHLLGFHPYQEIAFLGKDLDGFAYDLCGSKLQYLGSFGSVSSFHGVLHESFIYTPCMDDSLPLAQEEDFEEEEDAEEEEGDGEVEEEDEEEEEEDKEAGVGE